MQRDVHQSLAARREHLRQARERLGVEHAVAHDAEPAAVLRDQHVAVRQEGERPGAHQASHGHHPEALLLRVKHLRLGRRHARRLAVQAVAPLLDLLDRDWRVERHHEDGGRRNREFPS